jgi:1,2-phenylacetyl-CoA epoxidase PaaB subunit
VTLAKWLKIWAVRSAAVEDMVSNNVYINEKKKRKKGNGIYVFKKKKKKKKKRGF